MSPEFLYEVILMGVRILMSDQKPWQGTATIARSLARMLIIANMDDIWLLIQIKYAKVIEN